MTRLLTSVNALPDAGILVVADNGSCLGVVGGETLLQGFGVIIGALNQGLASQVIRHGDLGRVEDLVVRAAGSRVHQSACDACYKERIIDLQLYCMLQFLVLLRQHFVKRLGLSNCAGKTVKDETESNSG